MIITLNSVNPLLCLINKSLEKPQLLTKHLAQGLTSQNTEINEFLQTFRTRLDLNLNKVSALAPDTMKSQVNLLQLYKMAFTRTTIDLGELVQRVRDQVASRGARTIRGLGRTFRALDSFDGNNKIDP